MDLAALETLALRAVELAVQGRADPRFLVASTRGRPGPKKTARYLAGLANAARNRTALLLLGVAEGRLHGLDEVPSQDYWDRVRSAFPGDSPGFEHVEIDMGTTRIVAVHVLPAGHYVVATRRGEAIVPWFENAELGLARPDTDRPTPTTADQLPSLRIRSVWVERSHVAGDDDVVAYRGAVDVTLAAAPGMIEDDDVSVTLLVPGMTSPVSLNAQIHPADGETGVLRRDRGVEVVTSFAARIYVAGARRGEGELEPSPLPAQLVVALLLPGRSEAELRSLVLRPDENLAARWVL